MKKTILTSIIIAAAQTPSAVLSNDFIAKHMQSNGAIISLTSVPCANEPGHKALIAQGNWMGEGCYLIMPDGSASIRWKWKKDAPDSHQRIEASQIQPVGQFKGWPKVDWQKQEPLSPKGNRG